MQVKNNFWEKHAEIIAIDHGNYTMQITHIATIARPFGSFSENEAQKQHCQHNLAGRNVHVQNG